MMKPLAITAVAMGLAVAAPFESASAQPVSVRIDAPEFGIRIGLPVPPVFVPAPVLVAPPHVVVSPPPRVIVAPPPVYYPAPYYRASYPEMYRYRHHRHWDQRRGRWHDHDGRHDHRGRHRWD